MIILEIKVNDYVRTKRGQIHKITDLKGYYENDKLIEDRQYVYIDNHFSGWDLGQFKELITKSSPQIIDLICVGDYVNGCRITYINEPNKYNAKRILNYEEPEDYVLKTFDNEDIKSIVTKEMFEQMEYKVGEIDVED